MDLFGKKDSIENDFRILLGTDDEGTNMVRLSLSFDAYKDLDITRPLMETLHNEHGICYTGAEKLAKIMIKNMSSSDLANYINSIRYDIKGKIVLQTDNYALAIVLSQIKNAKIYRIAIDDEDLTIPLTDSHYYRTIQDVTDKW